MKNYQSTTEGSWIELLKVELTEEQKTLLMSTDEADKESKESKESLREWIKSEREGRVEEAKTNELISFYENIKPELKEEDNYHLVSMDISEKNDKFTGILNCRVNGQHKQIRF